CLDGRLKVPGLALIYTAIGLMGRLDRPGGSAALGPCFTGWAETYLLPGSGLACTAPELFAARCDLLDGDTPDVGRPSGGGVRRVCFAWDEGSAEHMREVINKGGLQQELVAVNTRGLYAALVAGVERFHASLGADPERAGVVYGRVGVFYATSKDQLLHGVMS